MVGGRCASSRGHDECLASRQHGPGHASVLGRNSHDCSPISTPLSQRYDSLGIDIIKVLCPLHYGMDFAPEDVYAYYARIAQAVRCDVMIYNQPKRVGVNVSPAVIARLVRDFPQIALLEDTNFNQVAEIKALVGDTLSIFIKFPFWLPASALGCDGMYSWLPYAPAEVRELSELCVAGNIKEARALFYERYDLYALSDIPYVAGLKLGLEELGFRMGGRAIACAAKALRKRRSEISSGNRQTREAARWQILLKGYKRAPVTLSHKT